MKDAELKYRLNNCLPNIPVEVSEKISTTLENIDELSKRTKFETKRRGKKYLVLLVAVMILLVGATAVGANIAFKERLQNMPEQEKQEYILAFSTGEEQFFYNRRLSQSENTRLSDTLLKKYENEGLFPSQTILIFNDANINGLDEMLIYDPKNSTIILPNHELSDEEILEIIDLFHKADYVVQKQADKSVMQDEETYESIVDLPIISSAIDGYEFAQINDYFEVCELKTDINTTYLRGISGNKEYMYVADKNVVIKYRLVNLSDEEIIYEAPENCLIWGTTSDTNNNVYISLLDSSRKKILFRISDDGAVQEYDLANNSNLIPYAMTALEDGRLFVTYRTGNGNSLFSVFDESGKLISECHTDEKYAQILNEVSIDVSGNICKMADECLFIIDGNTYEVKGKYTVPVYSAYSVDCIGGKFLIYGTEGIYTYDTECGESECVLNYGEYHDAFGEGIKTGRLDCGTYVIISKGKIAILRRME